MRAVQFENEENLIRDFLSLPTKLYRPWNNMENPEEVRGLLMGTHPLSKYFSLAKWVVYDDGGTPVARFAITVYPGETTAYFGFYECVDRDDVAQCAFDTATAYCSSRGFARILGPIDASFWLKYRLKINKFDCQPYTGEPYNRAYYLRQFRNNGFAVCAHYTSQSFESFDHQLQKYGDRLEKFTAAGYEIRSPKVSEFEKAIGEVYDLISELYADFPVYKPISKEDFCTVFASYKQIMNMQMVKMAYFEGKPVGFYVSVPDYGNLVYHTSSLWNLLKILCIKRKPSRYVMLYMGVDQGHRGLGKAIAGSIILELMQSHVPSIGALAQDGKLTQNYASENLECRYEYVLLDKKL